MERGESIISEASSDTDRKMAANDTTKDTSTDNTADNNTTNMSEHQILKIILNCGLEMGEGELDTVREYR